MSCKQQTTNFNSVTNFYLDEKNNTCYAVVTVLYSSVMFKHGKKYNENTNETLQRTNANENFLRYSHSLRGQHVDLLDFSLGCNWLVTT